MLSVDLLSGNNPDGFHSWTPEEVEQFEQRHPIGTKARLALGIMLFGGCARSSDARQIGRQHMTKDNRLQYTQYKNRKKSPVHIDIKVKSELRQILDASPTGDLTFLVNQWGNAFTEKGFYNWFKRRCREAGLDHCSPHGVRKAAAVRLAEIGYTNHEIMADGGWRTLKEVQRYTKGVRWSKLADSGTDKLEAYLSRTKVSNQSGGGK